MSNEVNMFKETFDLESAISVTKDQGYFFATDAISDEMRVALEEEINSLPLKAGDHVARPINHGKPNEVQQRHERLYVPYGDIRTPVANLAIRSLTNIVRGMDALPELRDWQLNEIGYQRYRHSKDFIGPHRDRGSDRLLSVTVTINGAAQVKIFESKGAYWDYSNIKQTDEFVTSPGSVMLLRAPGLGSGEQVIHQVLPPENSRAILNLRDRPTILENPSHTKWES